MRIELTTSWLWSTPVPKYATSQHNSGVTTLSSRHFALHIISQRTFVMSFRTACHFATQFRHAISHCTTFVYVHAAANLLQMRCYSVRLWSKDIEDRASSASKIFHLWLQNALDICELSKQLAQTPFLIPSMSMREYEHDKNRHVLLVSRRNFEVVNHKLVFASNPNHPKDKFHNFHRDKRLKKFFTLVSANVLHPLWRS